VSNYTSAELSAADIASAAADRPILLGRNWVRGINDLDWRTTGRFDTGSDAPDAAGPTSYAYDDHDHRQTYPASAQTIWYLLIDLGDTDPGIVDTVVILNHNLGTLTNVQTDIQIADNNAFNSNLITVATQTPTTDKRLVFPALFDTGSVARRYSDVRWMRIKFGAGGGVVPRVGEVIIGRRRQLKHKPLLPLEKLGYRGSQQRSEAGSGASTSYSFYKGRRKISHTYPAHEDAYKSDLEAFFVSDTDYGTLPFIMIPDPATAPTDAIWCDFDSPDLIDPLVGYTEQEFRINAMERGPNFLSTGI